MADTAVRPIFMAMCIAAALSPAAAWAQGTFPPSSFQNLPGAGQGRERAWLPLEQFDFVSDEKATKRAARAMMRLTHDINRQLDVEPRRLCSLF